MPIREAFYIFAVTGFFVVVEATSTPVSIGIGDLPLPDIILQAHSAWPSLCG